MPGASHKILRNEPVILTARGISLISTVKNPVFFYFWLPLPQNAAGSRCRYEVQLFHEWLQELRILTGSLRAWCVNNEL